jgi:hypothetical protein
MMADLKERNKKILDNQPWTLGIIEAMGMLEIVIKQKFDTKNRVALILLDSNFEIALKEFIVNRTDLYPRVRGRLAHVKRRKTENGGSVIEVEIGVGSELQFKRVGFSLGLPQPCSRYV